MICVYGVSCISSNSDYTNINLKIIVLVIENSNYSRFDIYFLYLKKTLHPSDY